MHKISSKFGGDLTLRSEVETLYLLNLKIYIFCPLMKYSTGSKVSLELTLVSDGDGLENFH